MKVRIRRGIIIAGIAAVILAGLIYGFMPKPVDVETAKAHRGPLEVTLVEEGKTWVKDRYVVSAPVSGFLSRVTLKAGDAIQRDETLFALRPLPSPALDPRSRAEALSTVEAARASVAAAQKQEQSLKVELDFWLDRSARFNRLYRDGAIAREQFDQADATARRLEAQYLAAQATTRVAQADLQRAQSVAADWAGHTPDDKQRTIAVRAPSAGQVLRVFRESEGAVQVGEPILEIGDPANIEVRVELMSTAAVQVAAGTPVRLTRWGGSDVLDATVRRVEPSGFTKVSSLGVEEQRVLALLDLTGDGAGRTALGDAFRVEATFIVWSQDAVLQVPASALFRAGNGWALYKTDGRRAFLQSVEVGRRSALGAQILSGVEEGQSVIVQPDAAIRDGSRVRIRHPRP